jgi:uncharacterized membrane protein YdjX (TVP38/TMEM64 family)
MKLISAIKKYRIMVLTFSVQLVLMALFHFSAVTLIQEWLTAHGENQTVLFWTLAFLFCIPMLSIGLMSSTFLAIVAGYFLSWESLYYYIPTYITSAYIGYKVIAFIDKGETIISLNSSARLSKIKNYLQHYPFSSVLFLRFSPIISFGQLTALCAFLNINTITYTLSSSIGMLPRTIFAIWCGVLIKAEYGDLEAYSMPQSYTPIIAGLFLISLIGILYTFKRSLSKTKVLY